MKELPEFYKAFDKRKPKERQAPANTEPLDPKRVGPWAMAAFDAELEILRTAANGVRNQTFNKVAFNIGQIIGGGGLDESECAARLRATAIGTGLTEREVDATLRSGITAGMQKPRTPPQSDYTRYPAATIIDAPDVEQSDADAFWKSRELLSMLFDYARARRVSPWAVLGVTLARIVTATPPWVTLPPIIGGYGSLNIFVGLVGPSGTGKGASERVSDEALDVGHLTRHTAGSGEGIAHGFMKRTRQGLEQHTEAVLFTIPEIDTLTALGNRQGATLMPELRRAWSGERLGFGYADPTKNLPVEAHKYRLCLVAGIQPARAQALLDDEAGGTPQRFLWLPSTDPDMPDIQPVCPEPMEWAPPRFGYVNPSGYSVIEVCTKARDIVDKAHLERSRGGGHALDGHALFTQLKTAAALALADGRISINEDDWDLSDVIAQKSANTRARVAAVLSQAVRQSNAAKAHAEAERTVIVSEHVADAAIKRVSRNVVKVLRREGDWVSASDIRKSVTSRDRGHVDEAIERLIDAGQVEDSTTNKDLDGHGGKGQKYRILGVTE